jgi:sugar/nucleoside kinase (ribokinase family)
MAAARRQGLATAYAGAHGSGPFGDRARAALAAEGIEVLQAATADLDTGYDLALTDADGERTFVTVFGAEATLTAEALAAVHPGADDLVHVSGYGLLGRSNGAVLGPWLAALGPGPVVLLDPGPLVRDIPAAIWQAALDRADWLSSNVREAVLLTGRTGADAVAALLELVPNVILRLGPDGCLVGTSEGVTRVPGIPVTALDTNGAGDAHAGAFLAALARGESPAEAARVANAAAAIAVTRRGPATAPTLAEAQGLLDRTRG